MLVARHAAPSPLGLVLCLGGCLFAQGCGTEPAPWTGFDPLILVDASVDATTSDPPVAGDGAVGSSGSRAAPPVAGEGAPLPEAGRGSPVAGATPPTAGTGAADGGSPPVVEGPPVVFRIGELMLRDPHLFAGLSDVTEAPVLGQSVNRVLIPNAITKDADSDGMLDVSILLTLPPLASLGSNPDATLRLVSGSCMLRQPSSCTRDADAALETTWPIELRAEGVCLGPIAGTTGTYTPAIASPRAPCFVTTKGADMVLDLGGVKIAVTAVQVAAQVQQGAAPKLVTGLLAGFVTSAAAMAAVLPSSAGSMLSGQTFGSFVRRQDYDRDESPNTQDGFWMYMNFTATPVQYTP